MKALTVLLGVVNLIVVVDAGWIRTYEIGVLSIGNSVRQTKDGGFIVTGGYLLTPEGYADLFLLKTDNLGDSLWMRSYGWGTNDEGACVRQTKDGGFIILGFANANMWGNGDIWLLKIDANGDTLWTKLYRGMSHTYGGWVEQTSDGGYILTSNWDAAYLLLLKTDKDGNTEWSKNYQWGDKMEIGYCVRQTNDGGYIVATSLGLLKTDSNGDSLWMKPWVSECVEQTADGGYILASEHNGDVWLIKTDPIGDTVWTKTYGGDSTDQSCEIYQVQNGEYIVIGASASFGGIWLLRTDTNGDTIWTRILGKGGGLSVHQTDDEGFIITGYGPGSITISVVLIKTDSLGYVGVSEPVTPPASANWQVVSPVGSTVTLRYENQPKGFYVSIFDASGRKVDEIESKGPSGTITWGQGVGTGVYFVRVESSHPITKKIVLIR